MKNFALFLLAALVPCVALPQAYSFASPAQVAVSGFVLPGSDSGFIGYKASGSNNCTGSNLAAGQFRSTQGNAISQGMPCALSLAGSYDLRIGVGNFPTKTQSYYSYIRVVDCTGTTRIYTTASATFGSLGSAQFWTWGTGSNPVFTDPIACNTNRQLTIFR